MICEGNYLSFVNYDRVPVASPMVGEMDPIVSISTVMEQPVTGRVKLVHRHVEPQMLRDG